MSSRGRNEFLEWHQSKVDSNFVFDFSKEIRAYCRSDVDIFRRGMMDFRSLFMKICNIDPLLYVTIASVVMDIFRELFMNFKEIAIVKDTTRQENFSKVSIKWLNYLSETTNVSIQHALNGGEYIIDEVGKVDGYCKAINTVHEFQGCFWHGCPTCYSGDTINTRNQIDMGTLNKRTLAKNKKIRELGYNLVTVYECEACKAVVNITTKREASLERGVPMNFLKLSRRVTKRLRSTRSGILKRVPRRCSNLM